MTKHFTKVLIAIVVVSGALAQEQRVIPLPKPQLELGRPLMQVLKDRRTVRDFSREELSPQTVANLLWAGFGINRPESGHRTAPSAMNAQEIDLYLATADGLFVYDALANRLKQVLSEDIRPRIGSQEFTMQAPVTLIFVADHARMVKAKPQDKDFYAAIDTGFISQNIYLYCASEGLGTVVHALGDRAGLAEVMRLGPEQKVVIAQAVGHPKKQ